MCSKSLDNILLKMNELIVPYKGKKVAKEKSKIHFKKYLDLFYYYM